MDKDTSTLTNEQVLGNLIALLEKATTDYADPGFTSIGKLNISSYVGERLIFGAESVLAALREFAHLQAENAALVAKADDYQRALEWQLANYAIGATRPDGVVLGEAFCESLMLDIANTLYRYGVDPRSVIQQKMTGPGAYVQRQAAFKILRRAVHAWRKHERQPAPPAPTPEDA